MEEKSRPKDEFTDLLFSWTLTEILDDDLYKYQVENIPDLFESVDQYLSSYVYPLLDETRAAIASSLETIYKAPFAEVTSLTLAKHESVVYDVRVDQWRNKISDRGKEPYRTLPGDLVLLLDSKPESVSDLNRIGRIYTFASVIRISEDEKVVSCTSSHFKLRTARNFEVGDQSLYVVFLANMTTNKRIWKSLNMRQNLKIIEKVLVKNDPGDEDCEFCPKRFESEVEDKYLPTLSSKLNDSQLGAVMACISKIGCNHQSSVELIWGPPGTGKTSTLSSLLYILLRMNVRTLICAPTNTAIKALAAQVTALVKNSVKTESGNSILDCSLAGLLLFGNNDRLKVDSEIEDIFLEYRVNRLTEILVPLTGWRHRVMSMLGFLENCVSHYQIFVENEEKIKFNSNIDGETGRSESVSFLEFVRDRFTNLVSSLRSCMLTVITHIPRSSINEKIVQLFHLFDSLEKLLFEESGIKSKDLENIFLQEVSTCSESSIDTTSSLLYIRSQSVCILRSLPASLSQIGFPVAAAKTFTEELCFQNASLIFCTISSAFKLHSVDMDPFQLLVIDEAAQVKECETTIAFQIKDVRHAILVGDECQLPATVVSKLSEEAGFGRSLFGRLGSMGNPKHLLNVQYRMHPSISLFPNSNFYQNQILDGPNVVSKSYRKSYLQGNMFAPYSFINVRGGREELDDVGVSRRNMVEVAVVMQLVKKLFRAWNGEKLSVGLISPYAAQVAAIHDKVQRGYDNLKRFTVKVKSIDGFQGGEEDIIIISTVRSHRGGSIGFLCSPQRTNVALTRARHCLWILGNATTLSKSDSVWQEIVSDAKDRQCFFNADEDCDIGKAIVDVKKELAQLDDLLSGDSILFKNSRWQVLFSDNFRNSFHKLRFSSTKKLAINLLLKLSRGWRPRKVNVDWKCENSSYIIKQFKVDVYSIVCSVDIVRDAIYQQVLKVWDILPTTDTAKLLKRLDDISSMYTDDFIDHCNDKLFERNLEVPRSWSISSDILRFKNPSNNPKLITGASSSSVESKTYVESSRVSESLLLMKFYSLSSGTVNHLFEGKEVDLPFEVTDEEREIINFPQSSFILGRSGTGKTTIMTMKLYRKLQQFSIVSQDDSVEADDNVTITGQDDVEECHVGSKGPVLHQLFVTVSPKLCHAIKKNVAQIKSIATENLSGQNITCVDEVDEISELKDIPDTFVGIQQEKHPLILTFHKFLMMLDGTVGKSYFQRFPLLKDSSHYKGKRSVALRVFLRMNEVTYDRFSSIYWPHFNARLTKSLDSSTVFTEIMSHIKGGPLEGEQCGYKRSREDYISLCESRISTLCEEQRNAIYDIFEGYEKLKMTRGEFDLADFVSDIHQRLRREDFPGDKMDFVYVDEVQDLTMRQISLFRYICNNVDEGFVFSGDTAQTIARGIDFRFEDIRSLFYKEFLMRSRNCDSRKEKGLLSDMFNLSHNFRTHTGVLRLAQSVVDLLCYFFPHSIDVLAPETSRIYGESPLVLEPGSGDNLIISLFGHGGKWVGFGANQVIIVRDDSARDEISSYIGRQALVLTIVECKGLEFQDVLLYNFFGSSPLCNQWRVVYEFLKEKSLLGGDHAKSFPSFSQSRHHILCSELKQLYVAITRTRQRLWICENNTEVLKPMLDYWRRLSLVQVRKIDDSLSETMKRASTPEEWKSQGMKLLWEKNYEMATMCFEKAGEEKLRKNAIASGLRAGAESCRVSSSDEATTMLREAAEMFDSIDKVESAAECFYELGDYERAGRIYRDKCCGLELGKAGECFLLAGKYELAAEVYARSNFYRECLSACSKGKHFDLGLHYIDNWREQAESNSLIMATVAQEFLENCARECHKAKDNSSLMKFVRSFCSNDSKRSFLKSLDCLEELLHLEEESGNFIEASEIAKSLGNTLREVDLLEKAGRFADACSLILSYVISKTLWGSGNQGWPFKSFPREMELLNRAMSIALKVSETFHAKVSAYTKFLLYQKNNLSEFMHLGNASKQYEALIVEILFVRKLLDAHFEENAAKYEWDHEFHLSSRAFEQRIARNQVSMGTLVYLWNSWKVHSLEIRQYFDRLETANSVELEGVGGFCSTYFGLRLPDKSSVTIHLLNPDAAWVKTVEGFIRRNRNVAALEARHFALAAGRFWVQELVFVGLRVLDSFQRLLMTKCLPVHCRSMCHLHIFNISKFFLDSHFNNLKYNEKRKLQVFLDECSKYVEYVFPLDPKESLSQNMISLRGTEDSQNLLQESMCRNIIGRRELSCRQIGRATMIMFGSCKLQQGFYDIIAERLSKDSPWKRVIEILKLSDSTKKSESSPEALSQALYKALEETYNIHWRVDDYISPHCFLYLVERLLVLAPHPRGFFFTTNSSFLEYLMSLPSDSNPRTSFATDNTSSHSRSILDFVIHVAETCLCNNIERRQWIQKSGNNCNSYGPVFVLRLIMLLCVLCINWGLSFDMVNQKMYRFDITNQLPRVFYEALRPRRWGYAAFVSAVASAFKSIGDPLVVVVSSGNAKSPQPDAVYLDLRSFSTKTDIMETLFPRVREESRKRIVSIITPLVGSQSSEIASENGDGNLYVKWGVIAVISEAYRNGNYENMKSLILAKKVEVEEHIKYITSAIAQLTEEEHEDFRRAVIDDLNTLLSLFFASEYDSKATIEMGELFKKLEERRPQLEVLLLPTRVDRNASEEKNSDSNIVEEDSRKEDSVAASNPSNKEAARSRGNAKQKKKNNSKKGKGGGKRK